MWIDPTLETTEEIKAQARLDYAVAHAPDWVAQYPKRNPYPKAGQTVSAALPPLTEDGDYAVIIGKVTGVSADGDVTLKVLAHAGPVAGHHYDGWGTDHNNLREKPIPSGMVSTHKGTGDSGLPVRATRPVSIRIRRPAALMKNISD